MALPVLRVLDLAPRRRGVAAWLATLALAGAAAVPAVQAQETQAVAVAERGSKRDDAAARKPSPPKARAPAPRRKPEAAPRAGDATQAQLRALLSAPNRRALEVDRMPRAQAEALRSALVEAFTLGQASEGGFESSIAGRFEGWNGGTVVQLVDGTRWRQLDGTVLVHHAFAPPVVVYRSGATHRMHVEGIGRSVEVEQLTARESTATATDDAAQGASR